MRTASLSRTFVLLLFSMGICLASCVLSAAPGNATPSQGLPSTYADFKERCRTAAVTPEGAVKMYFDAVFCYLDPARRAEAPDYLRNTGPTHACAAERLLSKPREAAACCGWFARRFRPDTAPMRRIHSFASGHFAPPCRRIGQSRLQLPHARGRLPHNARTSLHTTTAASTSPNAQTTTSCHVIVITMLPDDRSPMKPPRQAPYCRTPRAGPISIRPPSRWPQRWRCRGNRPG